MVINKHTLGKFVASTQISTMMYYVDILTTASPEYVKNITNRLMDGMAFTEETIDSDVGTVMSVLFVTKGSLEDYLSTEQVCRIECYTPTELDVYSIAFAHGEVIECFMNHIYDGDASLSIVRQHPNLIRKELSDGNGYILLDNTINTPNVVGAV